jgi:hypothetical protein
VFAHFQPDLMQSNSFLELHPMTDTSRKPDLKGVLSGLVGMSIAVEPHPLAEAFPVWADKAL